MDFEVVSPGAWLNPSSDTNALLEYWVFSMTAHSAAVLVLHRRPTQ